MKNNEDTEINMIVTRTITLGSFNSIKEAKETQNCKAKLEK